MVSLTCNASASTMELSLEYSLFVIIPSALYPIFRMISSSFTSMTVPCTISPFLIVFTESSSICSKLNSDMFLNLLNNFLWGGRPCCNTYITTVLEHFRIQVYRCLYIVSISTFLFTYFKQLLSIGTVPASNDQHSVYLSGYGSCFSLPFFGSITNSV